MITKIVRRLDLQAVYSGDILLFRGLNSMKEVCARFEKHIEAAGEEAATKPHSLLSEEIRIDLCKSFEKDEEVQNLYRMALSEAGVELNETCWDRVRLRIQPSGAPVDEESIPSPNTPNS